MNRPATRGLCLFVLTAAAVSVASAQNLPDTIDVRSRKDGTVKAQRGQLKITPAGFQVFTGDKLDKANEPFAPDDLVRVTAGELEGIKLDALNAAKAKEDAALRPKDDKKAGGTAAEAAADYRKLAATPGLKDRSKRYLDYKVVSLTQRTVDEMEPGDPSGDDGKKARDAWGKAADKSIADWKDFVAAYSPAGKFGWEVWPAVRAQTRLQIERGRYDDAATAWANLKKVPDLPADAKLDAALQEIDLRVRAKEYSTAVTLAADPELQKATGARKERLGMYDLAAKAGAAGKHLEGVEQLRAAMEKTKDPAAHAAGFAMRGELYLAAGKPRDAMWEFLWVETVMNQDRDEVFKALVRLADLFDAEPNEEKARQYRDKIRRFRLAQ